MTMTISQLINRLRAAQEKHGDLPVYTSDSDIEALNIQACRDGIQRWGDGGAEKPNELVLSFVSA